MTATQELVVPRSIPIMELEDVRTVGIGWESYLKLLAWVMICLLPSLLSIFNIRFSK